MKKFNSNFKSIVQSKARWLLTIIAILTIGVGQMWASWSFGGGTAYFDNSKGNLSKSYKYLAIGNSNYIECRSLSAISNTKLLYNNLPTSGWTDATYMAFFDWGSSYGSGSESYSTVYAKDHYMTDDWNNGGYGWNFYNYRIYIFTPASSSKGAELSCSDKGTSYSGDLSTTGLNYTVTLKAKVSTNGGSSYSETNTPGNLSASSYKFSEYNTCGTQDASTSGSVSAGSASGTFTAGYTANTTMSAASVTGYDFAGWYEGSTKILNGSTGTMNPHGAVTLYAYYKLKQYAVTYGVYNAENGTISLNSGSAVDDNSSSTLNHGTSISFTATPSSGYQVDGWYSTSACNTTPLQEGGNTYNAGTLTAATTVYVKFKVRTGGTITLSAGANGEVSADNSSWGTTKTITDVTTATDVNIYARGNTGYQFSSWTKSSGLGTIKTNAASGVFTTVAYEDATVTASFSEIMRTITISGGTVYGGAATSTTAGVATAAKITANAPAAGKKFTGWTLGTGVSLKGGYSLTDRTIEIYSTANATVTANYADRAQVKVYFAKPSGWSKVHAFAWKEEGSNNADWPGVEITSNTVTTNHVTYYYLQYYTEADGIGNDATGSSTWDQVIFSDNGSTQTADLSLVNGHYYFKSTAKGESGKTAALTSAWCIKGDWNSWSEDADQITHSAAATGSKTITLTTGAKEFKIYNIVNEAWWRFSGDVSASKSATAMADNIDGNMTLTPTIAGNYTFALASLTGTPTLAITYPTAYQLNYSIGTVPGNDGSISTSPSTSSGSYVPSGNTVTLTGPAAKTGYTWKGWYTDAAGTEGKIADVSRAITVTMNADKTLYACYTEDMHTVTVTAGSHGSITTPAGGSGYEVSAGISTSASIAATAADYGYVFQEWTVEEGDATFANSRNASTTVNATSDATVQANFVSHWTIAGGNSTSKDGADAMGDWDEYRNGIDNWDNSTGDYIGYVDIDLPANTLFYFKVRDLLNTNWYGNTGEMTYTDHSNWTMSKDQSKECRIMTAGKGTYQFTWNEGDSKALTVGYPTSYTVTYNVSSFYNEDASHDYDNTTGGTISYAKDNDSCTVATGKYVVSGGKMVFKATPATGFTFAGWYSNKECTTAYTNGSGGAKIAGDSLVLTIGAAKTVYAKFTENMTEVKITWTDIDDITGETCGWVKKGGVSLSSGDIVKVGVHTAVTLRAEADSTSHYYGGWSYFIHDDYEKTDSVGADYHSELTIRGKGAGEDYQSIYVSFPQLEKIYFKNWNEDTKTQLWDSVYVGFNPHYGDLGADVWGLSDDDVRAMQRDEEDTYNYVKGKYDYYCMWWSYVPRHMTRTGDKTVVFFNKGEMRGQEHFWKTDGGIKKGKAAYRGDYNKKNNMYVPASSISETKNSDGCDYYSNGYWRNFWVSANETQGYYLEEYKNSTYTQLGEFVASKGTTYENEFLTEMEYTVRLDNTSNKTYRIVSAGGEHYIANATITSAAPDSYLKSNNTSGASFTLTPTAEGNYVFKIIQGSDTMDISVDFPVAIGDYVLENTYNDGSAKTTRSDIIKSAKAADKKRYSMYLNPAGSGTLKLRKCTDITAGVPTWSAGDATNLGAVLTAVGSTPGVYQFDLVVDKSTNMVSSVDSLRLYTGDYYIKTDAAPGGWAGYTENVMDKNTVSFDRTKDYTFDNYWCKYFSTGGSNIKCVIANDYCNQLSDTLKQDPQGIATMVGTEPTMPAAGSVRFSYNSATNTINRAYLGASLDDYYLDLKVYNSGKVYKESTPTYDLYTTTFEDTWADSCRFDDTEDWVYEKLVKVIPGGKAGVVAKYQGTTQTFLPDTTTVLGGTGEEKYSIRLVYDFKTNFMMTAFVLDGSTINEDLANFDMLWVRHKDHSATQLTLGSGNKLTNVRPIGAIEFRYDSVHNSGTGTGHVDLSSWSNTGARQYLKYFVSFPFDVELNSIFGLNQAQYGRYGHYVIQKYDGAARAKEGLFFGDGDNYWVDLEPGDTLHANEGYCVIFDNDYVRGTWGSMWENKKSGSKVYLYFPAIEEIASITNSNTTTTVSPQTCTSTRSWTTASGKTKYHSITDSHWNLIGNPLFHDAYIKEFTNENDSILRSYYYMDLTSTFALQDWQSATITKGTTSLPAMSSVLVQWYGTINWGTSAGALSAPKRRANEDKNYLAELQIWYNGNKADQAFVNLSEDADADFVLREDMCKVLVKSRPNIYTFTGDYDVAYNEMPVANCTIPVGVVIRKNATHTFSMPSNFSGTVTLIDTYTQTRTNLGLDDYEIYLEKGTIDDRFLLEINISNAPTAIDGAAAGEGTLKDGKAHKFIMNDQMYILKDGVIYDARGSRVR